MVDLHTQLEVATNCCQKSMTSFMKQPLRFCTKLNASDQRQKKVQQYRLLLYISESNNTPSRSPFSYFCKQKSRASVLNLSFSPRDLRLQKYPQDDASNPSCETPIGKKQFNVFVHLPYQIQTSESQSSIFSKMFHHTSIHTLQSYIWNRKLLSYEKFHHY